MTGWMAHAACCDHDQLDVWWFAPEGSVAAREAVAVCKQCPVVEACLDYAIHAGLWVGVAGGMTARQRDLHCRRQGIPRHGTWHGYVADGCRCSRCTTAEREGRRATRKMR